jgi:hypothetical protein
MSPGLVLNNEDCPIIPYPRKQKHYQSFIANLQFAISWIRFDICFTISSLARFCASAGPSNWAASGISPDGVPRGLSKRQARLSRLRTGVDDGLSGFADSDWGNSASRHSTSGNLCLYNWSPILWQKTTALLTTETEEYTVRLQRRLRRFSTSATSSRTWALLKTPLSNAVYEDKTACIEWGDNGGRQRAKHID